MVKSDSRTRGSRPTRLTGGRPRFMWRVLPDVRLPDADTETLRRLITRRNQMVRQPTQDSWSE
jgi:hypothetical protein